MKKLSQRTLRICAIVSALIVGVCGAESARANAPAGRYAISNGTVYDAKTNLTWQQTLPVAQYTVTSAAAYCSGLGATLPGSWRLPTVKELESLVDYSQAMGPSTTLIDSIAFGGTRPAGFWSSTLVAGSSINAWYVSFADGSAHQGPTTSNEAARCVR